MSRITFGSAKAMQYAIENDEHEPVDREEKDHVHALVSSRSHVRGRFHVE